MKRKIPAAQVIILGFLAVILIGTLLLCLPFATKSGAPAAFIDALFTAGSATCVTGLITVDTGIFWSGFGQAVILVLIQIGGLGFMSMAMIFSMLLKRRVSPKERLVFVQSMNLSSADRLITFARRIMIFAFAAEGTGAVLLSFRFIPMYGFTKGLWYSVFHSVSSFCNAGFDILGQENEEFAGLVPFAGDAYVCLVISALIILGGIGFIVYDDIIRHFREGFRVSFYSRLVLGVTAVLLISGTLFFAVSEWNNPETLGEYGFGGKLLRAFFQSVTLRTAGFSTIAQGGLSEISKLGSMLLMFVGGSSGSTAGGIKTVTLAVVIISAASIIRGSRETNFRRRRIDADVVNRAFALLTMGAIVVIASGMLLACLEGVSVSDSFFEVFSAFGTVGVTVGITPQISVIGKLLLVALMFFGRVGIVSIMYAVLVNGADEKKISYPRMQLPIG